MVDDKPVPPAPSFDEISSAMSELRTATNIMLERSQFMRRAGISFNGIRDLYNIFGYDRVITAQQYLDRYARGGIAGRLCDIYPKATWRGGVELVEDENPKTRTKFEEEWYALDDRLSVVMRLLQADILAGLGRFAIILIGAPGALDTPLVKGRPQDLYFLQPCGETTVKVQEWDTSAQSPRFGNPTKYQLNRGEYGGSADLQRPVHYSRIVHISEGGLDNDVYGPPVLERPWNLLDDLDKVTGGGAEAFFLRANQGLHLDVDPAVSLTPEQKTDLRQQADDYSNTIRRIFTTRGVKLEPLGSDVAQFGTSADAILTQIAGSKGIPKRLLTGSEMGELASSQDRDNWKDQVNGRQTSYAAPNMVRRLVNRLIEFGFMSAPKQYTVKFAHIQTLTEEEKYKGAESWAKCVVGGKPVFTEAEIREKWYGMAPLPAGILPVPATARAAAIHIRKLSTADALDEAMRGTVAGIRRVVTSAFDKGAENTSAPAVREAVYSTLADDLASALLECVRAGAAVGLKNTTKTFNDSADPVASWISDRVKLVANSVADTTVSGEEVKLDKDRANAIAENEAWTAVCQGQRLAWQQLYVRDASARKLARLPKRMWVVQPGACDQCEELDGLTAPMDEDYPGDAGYGPPLHNNCRCYEDLVE
jgi:hypothetical protein